METQLLSCSDHVSFCTNEHKHSRRGAHSQLLKIEQYLPSSIVFLFLIRILSKTCNKNTSIGYFCCKLLKTWAKKRTNYERYSLISVSADAILNTLRILENHFLRMEKERLTFYELLFLLAIYESKLCSLRKTLWLTNFLSRTERYDFVNGLHTQCRVNFKVNWKRKSNALSHSHKFFLCPTISLPVLFSLSVGHQHTYTLLKYLINIVTVTSTVFPANDVRNPFQSKTSSILTSSIDCITQWNFQT